MTKDEIINNSKIIFFKSHCDHPNLDYRKRIEERIAGNKPDIDDFLKNKTFLSIGSSNATDRYFNTYLNNHHYTTKYLYEQFPLLANFLGFQFKREDFKLINDINDEGDYSYLYYNKPSKFRIIASTFKMIPSTGNLPRCACYNNDYLEEGDFDILTHREVYNKDVLEIGQYPVSTPYHRLYSFSHQCSIIENLTLDSNRKLCISHDSHMVPYIPLLACYFKKVVTLDNRLFGYHFSDLYENEYFTDCLLSISYHNSLDHILNQNF